MGKVYLQSPLGTILVREEGGCVVEIRIASGAPEPQPTPAAEQAAAQLAQYFAGQRRTLDFPIAPKGTEFQRRVWQALREIPFGETQTYGTLARRIGHPGACRAVGAAAGKNPCLIAVPCHRLVGAHGLTGFSCGLERKKWLLEHEKTK